MKLRSSLGRNSLRRAIFGYDIFISYSRKDSLDYAYAIAQSFMQKGYECYIDQLSSTSPGKELPPTIKSAVTRSTSFVLVGSESAKLSQPIENEISLFLQHNRNKPLIPITIDGSINNQARWFGDVEGLALINENAANLKAGTPSGSVLDRVENALQFTKKSKKLRNIAIATLITILLLIGAAAFYTVVAAQQAAASSKKAVAASLKEADANRSRDAAVLKEQSAVKATAIAEQNRIAAEKAAKAVKQEIEQAKVLLNSVNDKLAKSLQQEQVLSQKNQIQQSIFQGQAERANNNMNEAFGFGGKAFETEKVVSTNNGKYFLIDLLNSYSGKQIKQAGWHFDFDNYDFYNVHENEKQNIKLFNMNPDKTQVILYTSEPTNNKEMRLAVYPFDPPAVTWVRKEFDFGILDLKKDSCIRRYDLYGYFFEYSAISKQYYFITDDSLGSANAGGKLIKLVLDDHLNEIYHEYVNGPANEYLQKINARADGLISDFTYVHSFDIVNNHPQINLVHFGDTASLTAITIDSSYAASPKVYVLDSFAHAADRYSIKIENIKLLNDKLYYPAGKSIFEKNLLNNASQKIFQSLTLPDTSTSRGRTIDEYIISPALNIGFVMDTANTISIITRKNNEWSFFASFKVEYGLDSMELDEPDSCLIIKNRLGYSYHKIEALKKEVNKSYTKKYGVGRHGENEFFPNNMSFHIEGNTIVDNKEPRVAFSLAGESPTRWKFTKSTNTLVWLDSKTGKLVINDLSNLFLDTSMYDDAQFNETKFLQLDRLDSAEVSRAGTKLIVNDEGELTIKQKTKPDIVIANSHITRAGFLNDLGLIYYCSGEEVVAGALVDKFNIYDINTGYKTSFDLRLFLYSPFDFQITDKYVYFSEYAGLVNSKAKKTIRFVNPAISREDFQSIISDSFFNLSNPSSHSGCFER